MTEPANAPTAPEDMLAPGIHRPPRRAVVVLTLLLFAATVSVYLPALKFDFVNYDDPDYVTANAQVKSGLNWADAAWAFTTGHAGNWHPVTWLSHQADVSCFGLWAGGHHLTNVLFHAANTVLLFWLWRVLTGSLWRSALVAALFALHPAHVESVAWVSERKDVLSAFFGLLALLTYARNLRGREVGNGAHPHLSSPDGTDRPSWSATMLAFLFLALGLMSKPMLVTIPCVMLLLDFWPLRRADRQSWTRLLLEKWPYFLLVAISCVVTFIAQKRGGAVQTLRDLSLTERLSNALVSYARYLAEAFWPVNLATPYPHPGHWPAPLVVGSGATVAGLTVLAWFSRRRSPQVTVGWLWFVGMLVPVIGLVQVGAQSMADRYTYLPYIGLFTAVVWSAAWLVHRSPDPNPADPRPASVGIRPKPAYWMLGGMASVVLAALTLATRQQLQVWQNSETLFRHAVSVTSSNWVAYYNLGWHLDTVGKTEDALVCYRRAIAIDPQFPDPMNNIGCALAALKRYEEAIPCFESALKLQPSFLEAHVNIANALRELGRYDEAIARYRLVLEKQPGHSGALNHLGNLLTRQNQFAAAIPLLEKSLETNPDQPAAHYNLANALSKTRRVPEAITHYERALALKPDYLEASHDLGVAYARAGRLDDAARVLSLAAAKAPGDIALRLAYGRVLAAQQKPDAAINLFTEVLRLAPDNAEAHANLGPLLAMTGDLAGAISHLETAVRGRPDDVIARLNLARALAAQGRKTEASKQLQEVLRLRPDYPPAVEEQRRLQAHP